MTVVYIRVFFLEAIPIVALTRLGETEKTSYLNTM